MPDLAPHPRRWLPSPMGLRRLGIAAGKPIRVTTRRGAIELKARADGPVAPGMVFIPFCYAGRRQRPDQPAARPPVGKIPEYKFCAAKVEPAEVNTGIEF